MAKKKAFGKTISGGLNPVCGGFDREQSLCMYKKVLIILPSALSIAALPNKSKVKMGILFLLFKALGFLLLGAGKTWRRRKKSRQEGFLPQID
ncbi:MAG: hypothetical protein PUP92_17755 [Rhizonema sp. PD38]|nr:hypothetical protein [Rhizonema sp. PD38]